VFRAILILFLCIFGLFGNIGGPSKRYKIPKTKLPNKSGRSYRKKKIGNMTYTQTYIRGKGTSYSSSMRTGLGSITYKNGKITRKRKNSW